MSAGQSSQKSIFPSQEELVPFSKFFSLITEIRNTLNDVIELSQAAEHNKRICEVLKQRVYAVDLAAFELNVNRRNQEFLTKKNYSHLQNLVTVITQIKKFVSDISQMKNLLKLKYVHPKNIEKPFKDLCRDFDLCIINIDLESFRNTIKDKIDSNEENHSLKSDQEDLSKYLAEIAQELRSDRVLSEKVRSDVKELTKEVRSDVKEFSEEVRGDVRELSEEFQSMVLRVNEMNKTMLDESRKTDKLTEIVQKINTMNNTMEKLLDEQTKNTKNESDKLNELYQSKIDKIFAKHQLKFSDYEQTNKEPRKNGRVTKWVKVINKGQEFAFKVVSEEEKKNVQNQVTILRELHDFQNITRIYGLTCEGNKWYLVSEWAEYGNLREYYQSHEFNLKLKLRMSLDIARGLNFLRTVEIVHRDIRAENILITLHETAKLANFKLSRSLNAVSLKQSQNLERVRYCAPELLERAPNFKYDHKCEVYSFGILLWEIAEERIPYEKYKDIVKITDLVRNEKYREPFSKNSSMPIPFIKLANKAVNHDPEFRPKLAEMFEVLRSCFEEHERPSSLSSSRHQSSENIQGPDDQHEYAIPTGPIETNPTENLPDFESFKYMTLSEAAKQHKITDRHGKQIGDIKTAYKCFEAYTNSDSIRNQIMAKYYKAYYISRGLVDHHNKDKVVAELYKEVAADDETNEFPEAKLRYGDCLYNGKGVEKNLPEALKYFEQAAENGFKVAMYNAGKLYYNGGEGIKEDREKADKYMKLAIYHEYEPAIKFCREHDIPL